MSRAGTSGALGNIADTGGGAALSDNTPEPLGSESAGVGTEASRWDHVHTMPSASDVGALAAASNLSDLPNPATARDNLGLGDSAPLDVGDTAGTVAAGDDSRFPTASEKAALAGTDGTPSGANPFVTDSDPRLSGSFATTMTIASFGGF